MKAKSCTLRGEGRAAARCHREIRAIPAGGAVQINVCERKCVDSLGTWHAGFDAMHLLFRLEQGLIAFMHAYFEDDQVSKLLKNKSTLMEKIPTPLSRAAGIAEFVRTCWLVCVCASAVRYNMSFVCPGSSLALCIYSLGCARVYVFVMTRSVHW